MEALIRSYCFTVCFFLASDCTLKASPAVESMLSNVSLYFVIFLLNFTFILRLFQRGHIAAPQSHPCCVFLQFFFIALSQLTFFHSSLKAYRSSCSGLADWAKQDHWGSITKVNHQAPVALKSSIKKGLLCCGHIQFKGTPDREAGRFTADLHLSLSNPANLIHQSHPQIYSQTPDEACVLLLSLRPVTHTDSPVYFLS